MDLCVDFIVLSGGLFIQMPKRGILQWQLYLLRPGTIK